MRMPSLDRKPALLSPSSLGNVVLGTCDQRQGRDTRVDAGHLRHGSASAARAPTTLMRQSQRIAT